MSCENEGRDWVDAFTRQEPATISAHHWILEERCGTDSPSQPPERTNPADTLISDFWPPELRGNFSCLSPPVWGTCYSSLRILYTGHIPHSLFQNVPPFLSIPPLLTAEFPRLQHQCPLLTDASLDFPSKTNCPPTCTPTALYFPVGL